MSSLVLILALPFSSMSWAQSPTACEMIPQLERQQLRANLGAQAYREYAQSMAEISKDARFLNQASSGIAIVSASIGIGTGLYLGVGVFSGARAATLGVNHLNHQTALSTVKTIFAFKNAAGGMLGGGLLGIPTRWLFGEVAGNAASVVGYFVGVTLVSPLDSYFFGQGIYSFFIGDQKIEIRSEDLKATESELQNLIQTNSLQIQQLIQKPPGILANGRSLGRLQSQHMAQITKLAIERAEAAEAIFHSRSLEAELMKKACLN